MKMSEEFNYSDAMAELERIALKVEDPSTGIDDIGKYIKQSDELVEKCRNYIRSVREKADEL